MTNYLTAVAFIGCMMFGLLTLLRGMERLDTEWMNRMRMALGATCVVAGVAGLVWVVQW